MVDLTSLEQGEVVVQGEGEGVEASLESCLIFSPFKFLVLPETIKAAQIHRHSSTC